MTKLLFLDAKHLQNLTFVLFVLDDEFGAEGGGPSQLPQGPPHSQPSFHGHPTNQPSASNFSNIQIPPGSHAPANTPAEIPPPEGKQASHLIPPGNDLHLFEQQLNIVERVT